MDDFIILLKTKEECVIAKREIEKFLWKNLRLELNAKSRIYPCKMGVNFCGYRIFPTHRLLRTNSKKKIKKKVKKWNEKYADGILDIHQTFQSLNSWKGHASHCNSYELQQKILHSCNFIHFDSPHTYALREQELINLIETNKRSQLQRNKNINDKLDKAVKTNSTCNTTISSNHSNKAKQAALSDELYKVIQPASNALDKINKSIRSSSNKNNTENKS